MARGGVGREREVELTDAALAPPGAKQSAKRAERLRGPDGGDS
jgi:hypothetical protein